MTRVFHDLLHLIESHLLLAVSVSTYFENVEVQATWINMEYSNT